MVKGGEKRRDEKGGQEGWRSRKVTPLSPVCHVREIVKGMAKEGGRRVALADGKGDKLICKALVEGWDGMGRWGGLVSDGDQLLPVFVRALALHVS